MALSETTVLIRKLELETNILFPQALKSLGSVLILFSVFAVLGSGRLLLQLYVQQPFQEICGPVRISVEQRY